MTQKELEKIKLMAIINNDCLKKSDAVILLEGDGYGRINKTIEIFKAGLAKKIVISGGFTGARPFTIPASELAKKIVKKGVSKSKIIIEEKSQHTYEQGLEVMKLAKKNKWKRIILVASNFHQPRAYLTFLKAMKETKLKIQIFNAPVRELLWFKKTSWQDMTRLEILEDEFVKIKKYKLPDIKEAINYQQWKEKQK